MNQDQQRTPTKEVTTTAAAVIQESKEMQAVRAEIQLAKMFPRNLLEVEAEIAQECSRFALAEMSQFSYPRGGTKVEGPTIRLAETLARCYGNMDYGFRELERDEDKAVIQTFAWDKQKNIRVAREFTIEFKKKANNTISRITDPRDQYEHLASWAQRRVRAAILEIIPGDLQEKAMLVCDETLKKGPNNVTLAQRISNLVTGFSKLGINKKTLDEKLGHPAEQMTAEQVVEFGKMYNSLVGGHARASDFFSNQERDAGAKTNNLFGKKDLQTDETLAKNEDEKPKSAADVKFKLEV